MRYRTQPYILTISHFFFRVGLCPTHLLPFAGNVDAREALDLVKIDRMASITWTRVHAIIKSSMCVVLGLSDDDRRCIC